MERLRVGPASCVGQPPEAERPPLNSPIVRYTLSVHWQAYKTPALRTSLSGNSLIGRNVGAPVAPSRALHIGTYKHPCTSISLDSYTLREIGNLPIQ